MNDAVNRLAREMADAIAAAVAGDPRIDHCRERARREGYELQVSIEALIGFSPHAGADPAEDGDAAPPQVLEMTAHDRRFLRSLRIASDEREAVE